MAPSEFRKPNTYSHCLATSRVGYSRFLSQSAHGPRRHASRTNALLIWVSSATEVSVAATPYIIWRFDLPAKRLLRPLAIKMAKRRWSDFARWGAGNRDPVRV